MCKENETMAHEDWLWSGTRLICWENRTCDFTQSMALADSPCSAGLDGKCGLGGADQGCRALPSLRHRRVAAWKGQSGAEVGEEALALSWLTHCQQVALVQCSEPGLCQLWTTGSRGKEGAPGSGPTWDRWAAWVCTLYCGPCIHG